MCHFSYCYLKEKTEKLNYLIDGSVSSCGDNFHPILNYHWYGRIIQSQSNYSKNKASRNSAFFLSFHFDQAKVNYTNIEGNNATEDSICIRFFGRDNFSVESCNILSNWQNSSDFGTIYSNSPIIFDKCCVFHDLGNGKIFNLKNSNGIIRNCKFDNENLGDVFTTESNTFVNSSDLQSQYKLENNKYITYLDCKFQNNEFFLAFKNIQHISSFMSSLINPIPTKS